MGISVRRGLTVTASGQKGIAREWAIGAHRIGAPIVGRARKHARRGDARKVSGNGGVGMKKGHGTDSEVRNVRREHSVVKHPKVGLRKPGAGSLALPWRPRAASIDGRVRCNTPRCHRPNARPRSAVMPMTLM